MTNSMDEFLKAVDLMAAGRFEEAEGVLTTAINADPDNCDLFEALARLYDKTDQDEKGLAVCQVWTQKDPQSNMALSNLSVFHQKLNHIEEAEVAKAQATSLFMKQQLAEAKAKRMVVTEKGNIAC